MNAPDHVHHEPENRPGLTAWRRQVLDVLTAERRSLGAYDIIERIGKTSGRSVAPMSVYRALDFLVENGLAHRLASRNAFLACCHRHCAHETIVFLICDSCGKVEEATSPPAGAALAEVARTAGFAARAEMIEVAGTCGACQPPA